MSHSSGTCTFEDGDVYYFEYDGTANITRPSLFITKEELSNNWRGDLWDDAFKAIDKASEDKDEEDVILYSDYGNGFTYEGRASKKHKVITWNEFERDYL